MSKDPWLTKAAARQRAQELHEYSARVRAESDALLTAADQARDGSTALPRCPTCAHDETIPALRTELVQYYRCPLCGFVWPRPHRDVYSAPKTV
jgi:Zn ribbon nucleic-acid-binding protein